jgi:hypothetical protein
MPTASSAAKTVAPEPQVAATRPAPSTPSPDVQRIETPGFPDVTVLRTAWHPKPERRSAKVRLGATDETLTVHEGDAVAGLVLQEITPSAVVFSSGGIEVRRRVGESSPAR